jgi:hypothetical protein
LEDPVPGDPSGQAAKGGGAVIDPPERMRAWIAFYLDALDLGLNNDQARAEANDLLRVMDRAIQSEEDECVAD